MGKFSLFLQILPLIITLCVVGGIGFVLYHVYISVTKMGETASQKMGKKNVVLTKDGMRVGVKNVRNERYVDQTQSYVVKAWNLGQAQDQISDKKAN
ncbi:hypothetical protein BB8028_0002g09970 [Beauveria bassiana]|uniref:Uncharacterized protein n=1 Tax=Beauveria bassiana TaxID=176275 RepID=A0A2S7Y3E6_BEABA|nr:hypothetical protein BB8028_0002g09970 [Beauveria bassiana]